MQTILGVVIEQSHVFFKKKECTLPPQQHQKACETTEDK